MFVQGVREIFAPEVILFTGPDDLNKFLDGYRAAAGRPFLKDGFDSSAARSSVVGSGKPGLQILPYRIRHLNRLCVPWMFGYNGRMSG